MNIMQRLSLLWRRFSPLEERLIAAVREVLPERAQPVFDAQIAGITLVQRLPRWTEIDFYRRRKGKTDWSDVPAFPPKRPLIRGNSLPRSSITVSVNRPVGRWRVHRTMMGAPSLGPF